MPSFTLGCGTWGGSSVSENVTPMHLLNIKRVAYGLIDCENIVKNRELQETTFKPQANNVSCCVESSRRSYSEMNLSPAEIQRKAEIPETTANTIIEKVNNLDNEEVMDLVNKIIATMKK